MATKTFHRGLRQMKLAAWNGENTYGTPYTLLGARSMSMELVVESDEARGDDAVLDRFTRILAVTFRLEKATVDLAAMNLLTGGSLVSNGSYEDLLLSESTDVPYVAVAGRIRSSGAHDLHIFVPKAKIMGNLQFAAQQDAYMFPQVELQGVNEGAANGMGRLRKFVSATGLEIPLRTATGGL